MININECKEFKPQFNRKRFKELMHDTPTNFETPNGNVNARKYFVRSVLASCQLLWQELDRNNIYYGTEGSGKSHAVFQHTYIWWWCLNELGMINYPFGMHLIYFRLKDLMQSMDTYKDIPYMIYSLDESEELNRKNWNKPEVKQLMAKLRTERKNLRVVNLLLPALEELLPAITLSRINWIVELQMEVNPNFTIERGNFKLLVIPVGGKYYSMYNKRYIFRSEIQKYLHERLYNNDRKFETLPKKYLAFTGTVNATFVFDKLEYKETARQKNAETQEESVEQNRYKVQRDKMIYKLYKEKGFKQAEIAELVGIERSTIGDVVRKMTTTKSNV